MVFNTLNGDSNFAFFRELRQANLHDSDPAIMSFSIAEIEQQQIDSSRHFTCWSYFQTLDTPENHAFIERYQARYGADRMVSDPIVTAYCQVHLWRLAVERAGTTESSVLLQHLPGLHFKGPAGEIEILPNHHTRKSALIGHANPDGQFDLVWQSERPIDPKPWLGTEDLELHSMALVREAMRQFPEMVYYAGTLEDEIKRRKQAEEALVEAHNKLKRVVIANMSHELQTPLNAIIGFTKLLLRGTDGDLNENQRDSLERVQNASRHLHSLISDVLDLSMVEAELIEVHPADFLLDALLQEAVENIGPQAKEKQLSLLVERTSGLMLHSDRQRLLQCVLNYLSNAVKFTEQGAITISVREQDCEVEIAVHDTGIGIAEADIPRLFEAFEHLESHLSIEAGGIGLGLYLTKKIAADLLQGNVAVESEVDKGSTFFIRIPKELVSEAKHLAETTGAD